MRRTLPCTARIKQHRTAEGLRLLRSRHLAPPISTLGHVGGSEAAKLGVSLTLVGTLCLYPDRLVQACHAEASRQGDFHISHIACIYEWQLVDVLFKRKHSKDLARMLRSRRGTAPWYCTYITEGAGEL